MTGFKAGARKAVDAWLAAGMIAVSLAIRVHYAVTYHLNPDEGFHFLFAHQPTLWDVRLETVHPIHAYPPLYVFLLHFALLFGNSEMALRLPALIFGTVFLGVAYLWMRRALGVAAALSALAALAFSPGTVSLGYEVRNYALLLASVAVTLYALERVFTEQSAKWMAVAMGSLYAAILTNYSAAWMCAALGVYVGVRALRGHLERRLMRQWIWYQAGALVIYVWLYATHLGALLGSGTEVALHGFLKDSYYWGAPDNPAAFVARQSVAVSEYLFGLRWLAAAGVLLYVTGVAWLGSGRDKAVPHSRWTCMLLGLPPVLGCVLGLMKLYPYGASRHSAIYLPFLAAGAGYGLALAAGKRMWVVAALAVALVPPWMVFAYRNAWYIPGEDETIARMESAMAYVRSLPKGSILFTDHASLIELGYYLGRDVYSPYHGRGPGLVEFRYDGYRVASLASAWEMDAKEFVPAFNELLRRYRVRPEEVWVFDYGGDNLARQVTVAYPAIKTPNLHWFGRRTSVFQLSN
ncbi:MAG: glycosyltransferase family 39 protein [Bryobacterales bacterium]|nr:glycosyltransferase family 39 protein [Bryobacterales bacterium]